MAFFPRIRQAFCCFNLETGAIVIGWLGALFSILKISLFTFYYFRIQEAFLETYNVTNTSKNDEVDYDRVLEEFNIIAAIILSILFIKMIVNIMMIWGVYKRNVCFIRPWLFLNFLVISTIFLFSFLLMVVRHTPEQLMRFLITVITLTVPTHLYLVVNSLYHEIKEDPHVSKSGFKNFA